MTTFLKYTSLYEFTLGANVWRYTANAEDVIDVDGNVWESATISDDGVSQSGEAVTDSLSITTSVEIVPARLFMYSPPSSIMDVRILRADLPDRVVAVDDTGIAPDASARLIPVTNRIVQYVGEVSQCSLDAPGSAVFTAETISASMQREGLRLTWQRQCPYVIYDCGANKTAEAFETTVTGINGFEVTVEPAPVAQLAAGLLEYIHPVKGLESVTIESNAGNVLQIFGAAQDLYIGQAITLYRGCDQSFASCISFDNALNFGGIKDLPGKSPFDGLSGPVF